MAFETLTQPSIRTLADHLSLSVCTVSKAINGNTGVKESTRQRVIEMAKSVGYVPNRQAQILRQQRTRCIGLLLPTLANPIYSERIGDIYQAAERKGYEVHVTSYEMDPSRLLRLCRDLIARRMEAVIGSVTLSHDLRTAFKDSGIALLLVNSGELTDIGAATLNVDLAEGVRQLLLHLIKLGHRRPLLVGSWKGDVRRMNGIKAALKQAGLPENDYQFGGDVIYDKWVENAYTQTRQIFQANRHAATAVLASNDLVGLGVISALSHEGLSIPRDVSVTGIDNIVASGYSRPPLTTVSQTHLNLGGRAVEMIISILENESPRNISQVLTPELVVRESTGPAQPIHERSTSCEV